MIPVFNFSKILNLTTLQQLKRTKLDSDWFGVPIKDTIEWSLACDPESLWFVTATTAKLSGDKELTLGEFHEGLWQMDCLELFMRNGKSGEYIEWNLGPQGAWWQCYFSSYRQRAALQPIASDTEVLMKSSGDMVFRILRLPLSLFSDKTLDSWQAHVSAIVQSPEQRFVSSSPASDIAPDFHYAGCFKKLVISGEAIL